MDVNFVECMSTSSCKKKCSNFLVEKKPEESESSQAEGEPRAVGNSSIRPRPLWSPKFRCPGRTTAHGIRLGSWNPEKLADGWCFYPWFTDGHAFYVCIYLYVYVYIYIYAYHMCILSLGARLDQHQQFHGIPWHLNILLKKPLALDTKKRMNG